MKTIEQMRYAALNDFAEAHPFADQQAAWYAACAWQAAQEIDDLKADAARYRHMRGDNHFNGEKVMLEWYLPRMYGNHEKSSGERLDEAIDSAIAQQKD